MFRIRGQICCDYCCRTRISQLSKRIGSTSPHGWIGCLQSVSQGDTKGVPDWLGSDVHETLGDQIHGQFADGPQRILHPDDQQLRPLLRLGTQVEQLQRFAEPTFQLLLAQGAASPSVREALQHRLLPLEQRQIRLFTPPP